MTEQTDPRQLPGADPHTGNRKVDPVTGYDTTGHDWGGITELNTAFPKIVIWALVLTFLYSVVAWILLPAWPIGRDYTRGLLGLDQGEEAVSGFRALSEERTDWLDRFTTPDFAALQSDPALLEHAMPAAQRLFGDNCAACHGSSGQGGPGFPVLADDYWLWSGDPEEIAVTIRDGINANDDSRIAEMPSFGWMDRPERASLADYVAALPAGAVDASGPAAALFTENCAACHGDGGEGGLGIGAPSLTDAATIYGQDAETVFQTISHGRIGVMPAWAGRLSEAEVNLLAVYVAALATAGGGGAE
ncbi:cytochrome-c oxidase, cbb3-type subunit III [Defluviimonas sp. SAOS-178_SWC]|uniref:cytochrome-c oxidase, cbb3-type subunit III n=1 Tax=Defluviimonas sp. SAOS-178_SWC TaxID=3121287 RepID=UPI003221CDEC